MTSAASSANPVGRLLRRWPLLLAVMFTLYSALLLTHAVNTWQRMRQDANAWLVADSARRATALGDLAAELRGGAQANAELHEIRAYLANRDLGMSPRYGLNASLGAIDESFRQRVEELGRRWPMSRPRIVFYSTEGTLLAASHPTSLVPFPADREAEVYIDGARGVVELAVPVLYKNQVAGTVVTALSTDLLYRNLLTPAEAGGYREMLLSADGRYLVGSNDKSPLNIAQLRVLSGLADNAVLDGAAVLGQSATGESLSGLLLVKAVVPNLPLMLITFVPMARAYGHLLPPALMAGAGLLLLLMLVGSFVLDRIRRRTERLEADIVVAHERRVLAEFRNVELATEIGRREAVERALDESRERWELAVAGTNDGIWDWDIRTGEVFFSERWRSMLGYDENDLSGRVEEWENLLHPDDRERVLAVLERYFRDKGDLYRIEMRLRCKNGKYKWILGRGRAQFDLQGRPMRMAGSHTDITEQRAAAAALEDRNAQLNAFFSLSPDGLVLFDRDGLGKFANPAFLRMTGLRADEVVGQSQAELEMRLRELAEHPAQWEGLGACFLTTRKVDVDGTASHGQQHLLTLKRPWFTVLELVGVISAARSIGRLLYVRDVTQEAEVDRMKSEFLSHAAHELRTPMASIYGFSELLINQDFDDATRKDLLTTIHRQTAWLVDIINELLDLARIESRRGKDFKLKVVSLKTVVTDVLTAMQIDTTRWPLQQEFPDDLPMVRADAAKLRQVLTNVLGNAVKYSPNGGVICIRLTTQTVIPDKPQVGVLVTDHGIGMTPDQTARVCERFYRVDTSGSIPGTGLGMAIAKEIVELHGGHIEITSTPGSGSSVSFWLPAGVSLPLSDMNLPQDKS